MSQRRLFEMVYLLLEKGQLSASALAERFEVSVRTIYRDVDALSAAGVPIYSTPGRKGGIALMDHYVLNRTAFSEEEQTQILTALRSLSGEAGLWSTETLSKLSALFHRPEPDWLQVDLSHWGNPAQSNAKFKILKEAILSRKEITITYANSSGKTTSRRVYPARLVFKGQTWYLQGLCLKKNDYRTFRISRILHLSSTGRSFNIPLSPPPIQSDSAAPPLVLLRLRFSPAVSYRVYDEFDGEEISILPDGSLEVSSAIPEDNWIYGNLLSYGEQVEILSPERIRQTVGLLAKAIWEKCENRDSGCHGFCDTITASPNEGD